MAAIVVVAGVITHAFGMWDKHRMEAETGAEGEPSVVVLYWVCWLMPAGLVVFLFRRN